MESFWGAIMGGQWYAKIDGKIHGPFTEAGLRKMYDAGRIDAETPVHSEREVTWTRLRQVLVDALWELPPATDELTQREMDQPSESPAVCTICPKCGTHLTAPQTATGKTLKCPNCATAIPVPMAALASAGVARQSAPAGASVDDAVANKDLVTGAPPSSSESGEATQPGKSIPDLDALSFYGVALVAGGVLTVFASLIYFLTLLHPDGPPSGFDVLRWLVFATSGGLLMGAGACVLAFRTLVRETFRQRILLEEQRTLLAKLVDRSPRANASKLCLRE